MSDTSTHTLARLLATLSPDAHTRGKQFEHISKWWLTNTPVNPFAEHGIEEVWLWEDWPDRSGPDTGIDLVARLSDGSLCAIQAKCIDENADIPKSQLDSFISAASTRIYAHRLLIATTDGLSANARRMLQEQHVIRVMRTELENSLSIWPATIDQLTNPITQPKWGPRPHQQEAITNVVSGLQEHDRGQLIMACGTGKTLTALWITEQLNPQTTLVLVPSLSLLSQTLSEWAQNTNTTWSYICVCSDDTVNKLNDEPISTVDDFPFEVTTNPDRIAHFLATTGKKVIFSTYQSSAQLAIALQTTDVTIDVAICDEAHRLTGKTAADYATILDNNKIPATKRLFMTATPRTYTASIKKKAEERGVEITSMDDEAIYGPVLHKLSFGEAIHRKLLSNYRVVIVGVTDMQVQDLINRRELVTVKNEVDTDARTLAAHIGLAKATKDYNLNRTISFHSRINTAEKFAQDHPRILGWLPDSHRPEGTSWTATISGSMNTGHRRRLLSQLRMDQSDRHALLTNARCLTEGVDVPTLDGVAFIDPRSSQVDIIQAVGRAIRKSDNKDTGIIVLPVLIPPSVDIERAMEDSAFKPIWAVLNALKAHDDQLDDKLSNLRIAIGQRQAADDRPDNLAVELPIDIDSLIPDFSQKLTVAIVEHSTSAWEYMYGRLVEYTRVHGHARPPARKVGRDWFSQWVADQRSAFKNGRLEARQRYLLEQLPGWTWDPLGEAWNEMFQLLTEFVAQHGHAKVPVRPKLYRGYGLGSWVNTQRTAYNKGELEIDRVHLLEALPGWTWAAKEEQYQTSLQAVAEFAYANGHCRPPHELSVDRNGTRINLSRWIISRRRDYAAGTLTQARIADLESLPGWTWDPLSEEWNGWFQLLVEFVAEFGHAQVPQKTIYRGKNLASWVNSQRQRHAAKKLEEDRVERLESLEGWSWRPNDEAWERQFHRLEEEINKSGAANAIGSVPKDLKNWIQSQKSKFRDGRLSPEVIRRLESLNGWSWDIRDTRTAQLDTYLNALRAYVAEHGHASPSRSTLIDGVNLGGWIKAQRRLFHQGALQSKLVKQLESLPGWSWDPFEDSWTEVFNRISEVACQHGGTLPDVMSSKELSAWVTRQRKMYAMGQLSADRCQRLASIPGWTWNFNKIRDSQWDSMFTILRTYVKEHGTARVRDKEVYNNHKLGTWVSVQRRRLVEGTISQEQKDQLQSCPGWSWNPIEDDWREMLDKLREFVAQNGHARPRRHVVSEAELAQWVGVQRAAYRSNKISNSRIQLLEAIDGWQWAVRSTAQQQVDWERHFLAVSHFIQRTGGTRVAENHVEDGVKIAWWIQKQRKMHSTNTLPAQLVARLEALPGWSWDTYAESWELKFNKTKAFIDREGHGRVPQGWKEDGIDIGVWVNTQRTNYNNGKLSKERVVRLEALNGWTWDPRSDDWEERFEILQAFVSRTGHAKVPDNHTEAGIALGKWVGKLRKAKKNGTLSESRSQRLEALPGWTWSAR